MLICKWEKLPSNMQIEEIKPYWEKLRKKNPYLFFKRIFDIIISFVFLLIFSPMFIFLAIAIKCDSKGPVFYRQERYTQYGKMFRIHKFRSMTSRADSGSLITVKNDARITRVGKWIRKFKLDELGQVIDVFQGKMTFVGPRPEVKKYIDKYKKDYLATFLVPAGVTCLASILFKDENDMLESVENVDKTYVDEVLPIKMSYNLKELPRTGLFHDIKIMFMTFFAICGKDYRKKYNPND